MITEQSHIHQKRHPQRYRLFWLIDHRPLAALPVKECKFFSAKVQLRDPKAIDFNRAPCFDKSNKHLPVVVRTLEARIESSSSTGCMIIQPMPSLIQSVFKNVGSLVSYRARTGEEVIHTFRPANTLISAGVQEEGGICFR